MLDVAVAAGFDVEGFIDKTRRTGEVVRGRPVLGGDELLEDRQFLTEHVLGVGIGDPHVRRRYATAIRAAGGTLPTMIHPTCWVSPYAELGTGILLMGFAYVNNGAVLRDDCVIDLDSTIGHDAVIGDAAHVSPGVHVAGNVAVGEEAVIGLGANLIEKITIGPRTIIGAGAAVIRDVPADVTAVGVPAQIVTERHAGG